MHYSMKIGHIDLFVLAVLVFALQNDVHEFEISKRQENELKDEVEEHERDEKLDNVDDNVESIVKSGGFIIGDKRDEENEDGTHDFRGVVDTGVQHMTNVVTVVFEH